MTHLETVIIMSLNDKTLNNINRKNNVDYNNNNEKYHM